MRRLVTLPLAKLAHAANSLERGKHVQVGIVSRDELGALARGFESMSTAIQVREAQIVAKNRDLRLVLDNVEEGFITVSREGVMSDERSLILDSWFGAPRSNTLGAYLQQMDGRTAKWFALGWESMLEGELPLELCLDQLPRRFDHSGRFFELRYRPIMEGAEINQLLIIVSDITPRVARERAEYAQREMMTLFQRMLADRTGFDEFFLEGSGLVAAIENSDGTDAPTLRRQIHTLKGNTALFGLEGVASFCDELESHMADGSRPTEDERRRLRELWDNVAAMTKKLGGSDGKAIQLTDEEWRSILAAIRARTDHAKLARIVGAWRDESAAVRLARLAEQFRALAGRLDLGDIKIICAPTHVRVPAAHSARLWGVLAHVVRNVAEHGIEPPDERLRARKSPVGTVSLSLQERGNMLVLSIADDGRGIDWAKVAERARSRGMPVDTPDDLENALYADGLSTRDAVSDLSGRGVGMGAVRQTVHELGGRIEIESVRGRGTVFRFLLPISVPTVTE